MLDTICFSIEKINEFYQEQTDNLLLNRSNKHRSGSLIMKQDPDAKYMNVQLYQYNASEDEKIRAYSSDYIKIPSSTYNAYYRVDYHKNEVSFNLSIPKCIYGTNVIQFVPHGIEVESMDKIDFDMVVYKNNAVLIMKRLRKFIREFITMAFLDYAQKISWYHVRIDRLDLCYNQIFPTKEAALNYITYMKKVKKPRVSDKTNDIQTYKTSVYVVTQFYTFKVYHKGSEFEKNDLKELQQTNELRVKNNKKPRYKIFSDDLGEGLKDFSDRVVRYEVEFRSKFLTYLFRKNLFRKDCRRWKEVKKLSNAYSTYQKIIETERAKRKEPTAHKKYLEKIYIGNSFPAISYSSILADKARIKKMIIAKNLMMSNTNFYMNITHEEKIYNRETGNDRYYDKGFKLNRDAFFGESIMKIMLSKFYQMIASYQVTNIADEDGLLSEIISFNERARVLGERKINPTRIKKYLALMERWSIGEMIQLKIIDRTTGYRLEKQLKKFGYDGRSVAKNLHEGDLNFYEYMNYTTINNTLPLKNFFFK